MCNQKKMYPYINLIFFCMFQLSLKFLIKKDTAFSISNCRYFLLQIIKYLLKFSHYVWNLKNFCFTWTLNFWNIFEISLLNNLNWRILYSETLFWIYFVSSGIQIESLILIIFLYKLEQSQRLAELLVD